MPATTRKTATEKQTTRKERKRETDRIAQQEHRRRQRTYVQELKAEIEFLRTAKGGDQVKILSEENEKLRNELKSLQATFTTVEKLLHEHSQSWRGESSSQQKEHETIPQCSSTENTITCAPVTPPTSVQHSDETIIQEEDNSTNIADGTSNFSNQGELIPSTWSMNDCPFILATACANDQNPLQESDQVFEIAYDRNNTSKDQLADKNVNGEHSITANSNEYCYPSSNAPVQTDNQNKASFYGNDTGHILQDWPETDLVWNEYLRENAGQHRNLSYSYNDLRSRRTISLATPSIQLAAPDITSVDLSSFLHTSLMTPKPAGSDPSQYFQSSLLCPPMSKDVCLHMIIERARLQLLRKPELVNGLNMGETLETNLAHILRPDLEILTLALRKPQYRSTCFGISWILYLVLRWQVTQTSESSQAIPTYLRPTEKQMHVPHPIVIDFIVWPAIRDELITFAQAFPDRLHDAISAIAHSTEFHTQIVDEPCSLNPKMLAADFYDLGSWRLKRSFFEAYPQWEKAYWKSMIAA